MRSLRSLLAPLSIVGILLTGCAGVSSKVIYVCPPFPEAGEKVGEELENIPFDGFEDFWGWMDRIGKLHDQLDECR
jgi:hypothetical protein